MLRIIIMTTCALWGVTYAEANPAGSYSGSYAGATAGATAGANAAGGTGGYRGNYNEYDDYGYAPDYNFGAGFMDPYAFHQQLTAQILAQNAAHQNAIASTMTMGDAMAAAGASNMPNNMQNYNDLIQQQQAAMFDSIRRQNSYINKDSKYDKHDRVAPNYSAAVGSIGTRGAFQTAYISPENPAMPNIVNRFAEVDPDDGGFKGVSVSSYSSSSDINGKKSSHRGAQTTINDNGRITTYKVQS